MSDLKEKYQKEIIPKLQNKFAYKNVMQVPCINKVIISMGIAEAAKDKNALQDCINELTMLSGQKPIVTKAKKAISNFKLREGQPVGLKVTLRGDRMYDFIYRFIHLTSPRIRDFRGLTVTGDKMGNFSLGLDDQQVFPEINLDLVKRQQGMNITFITSANSDAECQELLTLIGMPFK